MNIQNERANDEIWRPVVGFPNYVISKNGIVKNIKYINDPFKNISQCFTGGGYLHVGLYDGSGTKTNKKVHRLVAEAWIPNPNNYGVIDHINKNKQDNKADNLRWTTHSINARNRKMQINNISGHKGITCNNNYYISQINEETGRQKNKYFSIETYGNQEAKRLAIEYRKQKEREFNYL